MNACFFDKMDVLVTFSSSFIQRKTTDIVFSSVARRRLRCFVENIPYAASWGYNLMYKFYADRYEVKTAQIYF